MTPPIEKETLDMRLGKIEAHIEIQTGAVKDLVSKVDGIATDLAGLHGVLSAWHSPKSCPNNEKVQDLAAIVGPLAIEQAKMASEISKISPNTELLTREHERREGVRNFIVFLSVLIALIASSITVWNYIHPRTTIVTNTGTINSTPAASINHGQQ